MKRILLLFILFTAFLPRAQDRYELLQPQTAIPFEMVNNLILLDIRINNVPLKFIFDTGVKQTILFNLEAGDSLQLRNLNRMGFTGVGKEHLRIDGFSTLHNTIDINHQIVNKDAKVYVITGMDFNFSENIGLNVNGFIGGELIKDYIVKIDYKHQRLNFYKHDDFNNKILKRYREFPLEIIDEKPYVYIDAQKEKKSNFRKMKLLIDTGNSDDIWIFLKDSLQIPAHQKVIDDYFGLGFSGEIKGKRIKYHRFVLDNRIKLRNVYAGLPDIVYFEHIIKNNPFDGLMGGEVLRRFFVILDYKNKKMYLKKYLKNFSQKFLFNNTGIHLAYQGKISLDIKEEVQDFEVNENQGNVLLSSHQEFIIKNRKLDKIIIKYIRKDSPADRAGLMKGDVLLEINGVSVYKYRLDELEKKFFFHTGKNMKFLISRKGLVLLFNVYNLKQL